LSPTVSLPEFRPLSDTALAQAKINLSLAVLGKRPDGYHELFGLMARIGLHDELTISGSPFPDDPDWAASGSGSQTESDPTADSLRFRDELGEPLTGQLVNNKGFLGPDNLVLRAVRAFRAETGYPLGPVRARLKKRIPLMAGLGGGSSDAAAALLILNRHLAADTGQGLSQDALRELALGLGADLAFFLESAPLCWAGGVGERLAPALREIPGQAIILINPGVELSTASVFAQLGLTTGPSRSIRLMAELREPGSDLLSAAKTDDEAVISVKAGSGRISGLDPGLGHNDLEIAATRLCPALSRVRGSLGATSPAPIHMGLSGSGPTFWALYETEEDAQRSLISFSWPASWWIKIVPLHGRRSGTLAV
jgi:4-diphosphocytidyl-2-C-methyl-D-erythritol kinase